MNAASFSQTVKTSHSYHLVTIKAARSLQLFAAAAAMERAGWDAPAGSG
jgi:hypothetical protein